MVKTLDRYIVNEMIIPFLVGVVGFMLIMVTDIIFTLTDLIINKGVSLLIVLKLLIYKLPIIIVLTFPVATLFAVAMALGRLAKDGEIIALRTSGISLARLSVPILLTSLFISLFSYITNEKVVPFTNHVSETIIRQMILKQPTTQVKENVFFTDSKGRYFYIREVDHKRKLLSDIMIYEFGGDILPRVILAKRATFESGFWNLEDGTLHRYDRDGHMIYEASFKEMRIVTPEDQLVFADQKTPQEMSSSELKDLMTMLSRGGVNINSLLVDFYMKYSIPLTCFVFALIAIPFSIPPLRSGRTWGVLFSICVVFTFYVFASVMRSFGYGGVLPPAVAAFTPQLLFTLGGAGALIKEGWFK